MTKEWLKVLFASFFELAWVTGLAHAKTPIQIGVTAIAVVASFVLLTAAVKELPVGTVYAVFAGLGSVGSIMIGVMFFNESISLLKVFFMCTLLIGILGLKLIESKSKEEEA